MKPASPKIGRITVAIGLVAFGGALLYDNLTQTQNASSLLLKLWPLVLVGFGVEYLAASTASQRQDREMARTRFDVGGAFLLALVMLLTSGLTTLRAAHFRVPWPIQMSWGTTSRTENAWVPSAGVREIHADLNAGAIEIRPVPEADDIRVEAIYGTDSGFLFSVGPRTQDLENVQLKLTEGPVVTITSEGLERGDQLPVRYTIYAPSDLKVKARTDTGTIQAVGYDGKLDLATTIGRIEVEDCTGILSASSNSGAITVRRFGGELTAKTSLGALNVGQVVGPMELSSGTGSIVVDGFNGGKLAAETQKGRILASTPHPLTDDVTLKTNTGAVTLEIPQESSVQASVETTHGSVSVPAFMTVTRQGTGSSATGILSDGAHTVSLKAGTGSVTLKTP